MSDAHHATPADGSASAASLTPSQASLTLDALARLVEEGTVDTVLTAIPDMFGRLMGKRFTARFFLEEVAGHGMEACDYLLGCDFEMEPQPGYRLTSWEAGYGERERNRKRRRGRVSSPLLIFPSLPKSASRAAGWLPSRCVRPKPAISPAPGSESGGRAPC